MNELNSNKYISLKTAAELFGYTRDHLGLMIRRNKLQAMKLGSYYVTTVDWMSEYIKNFADSNYPVSRNKLSNKFLTEILSSKKDSSLISAEKIMKRTAKATNRKNVRNDIIEKRDIGEKMEFNGNDLGVKILEALSQRPSPTDSKISEAEIGQTESAISTFPHMPYVVLPIRKMENTEREEILKKAE